MTQPRLGPLVYGLAYVGVWAAASLVCSTAWVLWYSRTHRAEATGLEALALVVIPAYALFQAAPSAVATYFLHRARFVVRTAGAIAIGGAVSLLVTFVVGYGWSTYEQREWDEVLVFLSPPVFAAVLVTGFGLAGRKSPAPVRSGADPDQ